MFIDFGSYRIFDDVNTYNCIPILQKDRGDDSFAYYRHHAGKQECAMCFVVETM